MTKIKGFKVNLRIREIQRRAKRAKLDLGALGLGTDEALSELGKSFFAKTKPAVIYGSFAAEGVKGPAEKTAAPAFSPLPGLAYSIAAVTLGPNTGAFIEERVQAAPELRPVLDITAQAALEEAVGFVLSMLEDSAKEEQCELSPIQYLTEGPGLGALVEKLEGHKIGIAVSDSGVSPAHSRAFSVSWLAPRTKSRAK